MYEYYPRNVGKGVSFHDVGVFSQNILKEPKKELISLKRRNLRKKKIMIVKRKRLKVQPQWTIFHWLGEPTRIIQSTTYLKTSPKVAYGRSIEL